MKKSIVLLVPDGRSIRNFVMGPFLRLVSQEHPVDVLHAIPDECLPTFSGEFGSHVRWHSLRRTSDHVHTFILRNSLAYAQMYWVDTYPMRENRSRRLEGSLKTNTARRLSRAIGRVCASPSRLRRLDRLHSWAVNRLPEVECYRKLFKQNKPGALFCAHQRPTEILPPVLAAKSLGIPTATFILSWDNLSTKGRIAAPFDYFFVWSEHMREELHRYYPDVSPDRVFVVGTPQFDPYAETDLLWSREVFFQRISGDPSRKLICYSGGAEGNSPEEQLQLAVLMQQIRDGKIRGNPQVLLRPAPADNVSRFDGVRQDYPELIYSAPEWKAQRPGAWESLMPSHSDLPLLTNLTYHTDVNINFASTMTLDFAIRDKPVINVAFDVSDPPVYGIPQMDWVMQFEHYRPVKELGAARFACTEAELAEHVNAYLDDPALDREKRLRFVELQVGVEVGSASQRILELLDTIGTKHEAAA